MSQKQDSPKRSGGRKHYVVAMVLGTALSALGQTSGLAAESREATARTVQDISKYCTSCWRNARLSPDCWGDCTQEVFSRLLQRVTPAAWERVFRDEGDERREFLRAIDAVKKRTQRSRKVGSVVLENVADYRLNRESRFADEREAVAKAAAEVLTPRQQRVLQLSFEGWHVNDIARELCTSADRVSDEKYKAVRKLRESLKSIEAL